MTGLFVLLDCLNLHSGPKFTYMIDELFDAVVNAIKRLSCLFVQGELVLSPSRS